VPQLSDTVKHMFRLDEDLSGFYERVRDTRPGVVQRGAGRMPRAPTVRP